MKHFYAGTFINKKDLENMGVSYPVKLEYYKTEPNVEEKDNIEKMKYGIEVIKTSYIKENVEVEYKKILELTKDETVVNRILDVLKRNEVTPISAEYVVEDLLKEMG